jgi:hypothetical protein
VRALTILVAVMTVLIVIATGAVVFGIAQKLGARRAASVASATVSIPAGARVEAMTATADRLVLALALPDGSRQVLVIDLATGRNVATIRLQQAP